MQMLASLRMPLAWAAANAANVRSLLARASLSVIDHATEQGHPLDSVQSFSSTAATPPSAHVDFQGHKLPAHVTLFEVGPRDGLQNERQLISTDIKVDFINRLSAAGLKFIEATSFVSPKWVPQLADAADVMQKIKREAGVSYPVLVPNRKGLDAALQAGVTHIAIFGSASEAFSKKNLNCSIEESLKRFDEVVGPAKAAGIAIRGYVSCVVGCPIQGRVDPRAAAAVAQALHDMGCYEVSMADTTGVGTPQSVSSMFEETMKVVPVTRLAAHMHDTYGQALANLLASLQLGVQVIDSSVAGLGGCPYAKGATGNVATEDVMYMLDGLGISHGVQWERLLAASAFISRALGRANESRVARAKLSDQSIAAAAAAS